MHEPGDEVIVADHGMAVAPGLHILFDIKYTVVSTKDAYFSFVVSVMLTPISLSLFIQKEKRAHTMQ